MDWEGPAGGQGSKASALPENVSVRGMTLPLVWLDELLGWEPERRARQAFGWYVAVLEVRGGLFGVALNDELLPEEIVVKPLASGLREIRMFSGVTVLGSGEMAMILDVEELHAAVVRCGGEPVPAPELMQADAARVEQPIFDRELETVLAWEPATVPLGQVA